MDIEQLNNEIKELLKDISVITDNTKENENSLDKISYIENPLNPNLVAYCFDNILGFDVKYRIAEKVNYIIDFDYKGTYASIRHFKMSYTLYIDKKFKTEILKIFSDVKLLLENLFSLIGEESLLKNDFSMKNEAPYYFEKLKFYEDKIEELSLRYNLISEKLKGQYDEIKNEKFTYMRPRGADYLKKLKLDINYSIEAYIDTFYSTLEHVITLLYPFVWETPFKKSYYKDFIRNTRWDWKTKINDVCKKSISNDLIEELRRIKEVYRNHNAHGGFSREMMAYVLIPNFGRFPLYIGKEYLKGFIEENYDSISYEMYLHAKSVFKQFWEMLDNNYEIPMLFLRSGLPIPVDTKIYMDGIENIQQAEWKIDEIGFDIDNQSNMDW